MNISPGNANPFFLDTARGRLFAVWHAPHGVPRRALLHVPAFGEEMNKSRRMVALLARALRDRGIATLLVDPSGTGDSDGELADATWQGWKDDLRAAHAWLGHLGVTEIVLWGHRLGGTLAAELIHDFDDVNRLLLWNPVPAGNRFLTQFLRLRAASSLMRGEQESAKQLREQLRQQGTITVAGCDLSERLAASIEQTKLLDSAPPGAVQTAWFDVSAAASTQPGVATAKVVSAWRAAGCKVHAAVLQGEPFWSTQEISLAPTLIDASVDFVEQPVVDTQSAATALDPGHTEAVPTTRCAERALRFTCEGNDLMGVLHTGSRGASDAVLVVVGGPQYRVGSHRQFVQLARTLSEHGIPVLRFDCRGMGDGEGSQRDFEDIQLDIRAAMDTLCRECPDVREVAIWGLCDGASAACFYASSDPRVTRLVLLNPWVRTTQGEARAYLAHYYASRLLSREFRAKLFRGEVHVFAAVADFVRKLLHAVGGRTDESDTAVVSRAETDAAAAAEENISAAALAPVRIPRRGGDLPERMANGLEAFTGKVLYILSGRDLTAQEFREVSRSSKRWRALMDAPRCTVVEFPEADHTFTSPSQSAAATQATLDFLKSG